MEKRSEADRLRLVIDTQTEIAKSRLDLEGVMRHVLDSACRITGAHAALVETAEGDELVTRAASGSAEQFVGLRLPAATSMSGLCVETGQVLRTDDTMSDPRADREACLAVGAISMICVPLRLDDGDIAGVLKVHAPTAQAFDDADEETLTLLSGLIVAGLGNAQEQATLRDESRRDTLTGLGNRRSYDEALIREAARSVRYGSLLSLVLFDIDGFKGVNDRFGHERGDAVLAEVGRIIAAGRTGDQGYRIGGDEFALILPETSLENAERVGGRVADGVAESIQIAKQATVSVGAAEARTLDPRALHAEADTALHRAKQVRAEMLARKIERRWLRGPEESRRSTG
ncbi:MAG: GGDEF domain-containing protein [Thermoleophilaceae bacterium]|nr:GGDEF domain-containing protein [Thermoleophilaceae bacterium]